MEFVSIDQKGICRNSRGKRLSFPDSVICLLNMRQHENGSYHSQTRKSAVLVESFDEPYIAKNFIFLNGRWQIKISHGLFLPCSVNELWQDEWNRLRGLTLEGIPFVAQRYDIKKVAKFLKNQNQKKSGSNKTTEKVWDKVFQAQKKLPWDSTKEHPILHELEARKLKRNKSVLVLGCGEGHDAAYLAKLGYHVTAVDISKQALMRAKKLYGKIGNIDWVHEDFFKMVVHENKSFHLIFENLCYCAISPAQRRHLIQIWAKFLKPGGVLFGTFYISSRNDRSPYGTTEMELRKLILNYFKIKKWQRRRKENESRFGTELVVLATRKALMQN